MMKELVVLAVLFLCSSTVLAVDLPFLRQCNDTLSQSFASSLNCTEPCSAQCFGALCSFYTINSYSALCNEFIIEGCRTPPNMVPSTCGTPSDRACDDTDYDAFIATLPTSCKSQDLQQICSDQCAGALCSYHRSTPGYADVCSVGQGEICRFNNATVPAACGAMAPVTEIDILPFLAQCNDTRSQRIASSLNCDGTDLCSAQCYGALCSFYTTNSYSAVCNEFIIENCRTPPNMVPPTCGAPSDRACGDADYNAFTTTLPTFCDSQNATIQQICSNQCAGALCSYHRSTPGYADVCSVAQGEICRINNATVPAACGAVATVGMRGMLAAVLLIVTHLVG